MPEAENIWDILEQKFRSGNEIPVRNISISRDEYEMLLAEKAIMDRQSNLMESL